MAQRKLYNLVDYIDTILHGTAEEKQKLSMQYYRIADTAPLAKSLGMKGGYFTIRYGVITHHRHKDTAHNLTVTEWKELCAKINEPLRINSDGNAFTLFLDIHRDAKLLLVGITVKQTGRNEQVNALKTVFFANHMERGGRTIYERKT